MTTIFKGDDTNAFGGIFISINLKNPNNKIITKAEFRCGIIYKVFENPIFPLHINLDATETTKLNDENIGYLAIYDEYGKKKTLAGNVIFKAKRRVV